MKRAISCRNFQAVLRRLLPPTPTHTFLLAHSDGPITMYRHGRGIKQVLPLHVSVKALLVHKGSVFGQYELLQVRVKVSMGFKAKNMR